MQVNKGSFYNILITKESRVTLNYLAMQTTSQLVGTDRTDNQKNGFYSMIKHQVQDCERWILALCRIAVLCSAPLPILHNNIDSRTAALRLLEEVVVDVCGE